MPIYTPGKVVLAKQFTWNETVWNPSMIQTALWLDAADAPTILSSSGRVSQWSDKSGNARHATQATGAQQPKITANAQNGRSVIEFDPASNSFQRLTFSRLTSLGHIFVVAKKNSVDDSEVILTDGSLSDLRGVSFGAANGSVFRVQQLAPTVSTATRGNWHIGEVLTDGATATVGIDAGRQSAADTDLMSTSDIGWYRNDASPSFVNQYSFRGQIAEIVISQAVLASTTRQKLEGYLAWKWGLTANLPAGHPYKTAGPTP